MARKPRVLDARERRMWSFHDYAILRQIVTLELDRQSLDDALARGFEIRLLDVGPQGPSYVVTSEQGLWGRTATGWSYRDRKDSTKDWGIQPVEIDLVRGAKHAAARAAAHTAVTQTLSVPWTTPPTATKLRTVSQATLRKYNDLVTPEELEARIAAQWGQTKGKDDSDADSERKA